MTDIAPRELARRYAAAWNEPDAGRRRAVIQGLCADDGAHVRPTISSSRTSQTSSTAGRRMGLASAGDDDIPAVNCFVARDNRW